MKVTKLGTSLASAAALAIVSGFASTAAAESYSAGESNSPKVKCLHGNSCKGMTQCATATNACAGGNSCKGQGWVYLTSDECKKIDNAKVDGE